MKRKHAKGKRKPGLSRATLSRVNVMVQDISSFYNGGNSDWEQSGGAQISSRMEIETPQNGKTQSNPLADFGRVTNARIGDTLTSFVPAPSVSANFYKNSKISVKRSIRGVDSSCMRPCNDEVNGITTDRSPPREFSSSQMVVLYKDQELKVSLEVIRKIMETDAAVPFNNAVDDTDVPDYYDTIDTPMDFSTVRRNLEAGVKYKNSKDVFHDVEYIWSNCFKYNKKGSFIVELGNRVKKNFLKHWEEAGLDGKSVDDICETMTKYNSHVPPSHFGPMTNYINHHHHPEHSTDENHLQPPVYSPTTDNSRGRNGDFVSPAQPESLNMTLNGRTSLRASVMERTSKSKASMPAGLMFDNQHQYHQKDVLEESCKLNVGLDSGSSPPMASSARTTRRESRYQADPVDNSQYRMPHVNTVEHSSDKLLINYRQPQSSSSPVPKEGAEDTSLVSLSSSNCTKKRGRGPTKCLELWNSITKITVVVDEFGHPVGNEAPKLINFLGTIARNGHIAPLNYVDWRALPEENKEKMWEQVQSRFNIDLQCKDWILKSLGKKWKDWKAQLKIHHYSVHDNDKDRLEDCDERVLPDQWKILVSFWNSDEAKDRSMKAKASRSHQKINHTSGTKSFARIREEQRLKMPDQKPPSRADLFIMTRTRKDGRPINEDSSKLISELREHAAQQQGTLKNGAIEDEIFSKVMGNDRYGRPRTYGLGPATSEATITAKGNNNPEVIEARKEVQEIKERLAYMEQSHTQMMAQMTEILSRMPIMNKNGPEEEHVPNVVIFPSEPVPIERVNGTPINSNESSYKEVYHLSSQRTSTRKRGITQTQRTSTKKIMCMKY